MEELGKAEKLVLGYIGHEYFGRIYFSTSGGKKPEEVIAKVIAEEITSDEKIQLRIRPKLEAAIKKLQEYWIIQLSGYEVKLTSYGQQLVASLSKDEYSKLKEEAAKGNI